VVRDQRPDATIGAIYHWGGFGRLFEKQAVDHDVNGSSEYTTAEEAAAFLRAERPTFTFVHLDHVDGAGHGEGHGTPAYYAAVSRADSLIGQILDAAREAGMADEMLVIVSADHGGIGYGHGGETLAEIEIPFILYGRGVKPGYTIEHPVYTYDNAATAAFALGLTPPYAWIGRPVRSAFEGFAAPPPSSVVTPAQRFCRTCCRVHVAAY
ncbi:MAG: alkaline phosphatase, partial [Ketobacteraceae bacterium]|nr:alkaline phosphatase [Ketobacteraceae bacterium]